LPYKAILANDQFFHVFNRGVEKRITFLNKHDYQRFIETLNYYTIANQTLRFSHRFYPSFKNVSPKEPLVEIISFCLMPNHFHLC